MASWTGLRWIIATFLAVAALFPITSWWLLLRDVPSQRWQEVMDNLFSDENPARLWFAFWAALPGLLLYGAGIYCSPLVFRRRWAIGVTAGLALITLYAALMLRPALSVTLAAASVLSVWWAYRIATRPGS